MTRADLIARLEKEGGSRELDAEIAILAGGWIRPRGRPGMLAHKDAPNECSYDGWPEYTTSLDASIALCKRVLPPNWQMEIFMSMSGPTAVALTDVDVSRYPGTVKKLDEIEHKSPATALCIALLRALEDGK